MFANRKKPIFRGSGWRMHIHVPVHVLAIWPTKVKDQHHIMSRIQKFFKKRGGGVGVEGTGMRNMNIVVSSHGREFTCMYVGADCTECTYWACFEMMEVHASSWIFFQGGRGVVAWGLDFHIVKKIVKFVSIFVLIISDVICNYKLLIW